MSVKKETTLAVTTYECLLRSKTEVPVLLHHAALPLSTDITKHGREVVARGAEGIARRRKKGPQSCSNSAAPFRIVEVGYIRQRH